MKCINSLLIVPQRDWVCMVYIFVLLSVLLTIFWMSEIFWLPPTIHKLSNTGKDVSLCVFSSRKIAMLSADEYRNVKTTRTILIKNQKVTDYVNRTGGFLKVVTKIKAPLLHALPLTVFFWSNNYKPVFLDTEWCFKLKKYYWLLLKANSKQKALFYAI